MKHNENPDDLQQIQAENTVQMRKTLLILTEVTIHEVVGESC